MVDSLLRIAHKYDIDRYQAWGVTWLGELYPSTDDDLDTVYTHPKWESYHDPSFLIRLLQLTELLDQRELDGITALACYALSAVNWELYNQVEVFGQLPQSVIARVITGQRRLLGQCTNVINRIIEHECWSEEPQRRTSRACRTQKKRLLQALTSSLHRDFVGMTRELKEHEMFLGYESCSTLQRLVKEAGEPLFERINEVFGFRKTLVHLSVASYVACALWSPIH